MSTTKPIKNQENIQKLKDYFLEQKRYRDYTLVTFGLNTALRISRIQAYRIIHDASNELGFETKISCHSLRKTFGYQAWKQGAEPALIMNIYNHSSYQITKRYLCIDQDDRDSLYQKINL